MDGGAPVTTAASPSRNPARSTRRTRVRRPTRTTGSGNVPSQMRFRTVCGASPICWPATVARIAATPGNISRRREREVGTVATPRKGCHPSVTDERDRSYRARGRKSALRVPRWAANADWLSLPRRDLCPPRPALSVSVPNAQEPKSVHVCAEFRPRRPASALDPRHADGNSEAACRVSCVP